MILPRSPEERLSEKHSQGVVNVEFDGPADTTPRPTRLDLRGDRPRPKPPTTEEKSEPGR